jgi:2-polyprenyl-6-methoxyphenol hydroxylase-like FAD-dependent oxidoreductase
LEAELPALPWRDFSNEQAFATYEHLRRERTVKMFEVGEHGDSEKHAIRPIQQWLRDLTMPIFLKLFANPKASDWMFSYRVDWDSMVPAYMPGAVQPT